jgi:hypothetical protein
MIRKMIDSGLFLYFLVSYAATRLSMLWPVRYEM